MCQINYSLFCSCSKSWKSEIQQSNDNKNTQSQYKPLKCLLKYCRMWYSLAMLFFQTQKQKYPLQNDCFLGILNEKSCKISQIYTTQTYPSTISYGSLIIKMLIMFSQYSVNLLEFERQWIIISLFPKVFC